MVLPLSQSLTQIVSFSSPFSNSIPNRSIEMELPLFRLLPMEAIILAIPAE